MTSDDISARQVNENRIEKDNSVKRALNLERIYKENSQREISIFNRFLRSVSFAAAIALINLTDLSPIDETLNDPVMPDLFLLDRKVLSECQYHYPELAIDQRKRAFLAIAPRVQRAQPSALTLGRFVLLRYARPVAPAYASRTSIACCVSSRILVSFIQSLAMLLGAPFSRFMYFSAILKLPRSNQYLKQTGQRQDARTASCRIVGTIR
jgi:hypothetical protein